MGIERRKTVRKERPANVERARKQDDVASLREFGRNGAAVTNEKKREHSANEEETARYYAEQELKKAIEEWTKTKAAANEHIVPVDPETEKEDA